MQEAARPAPAPPQGRQGELPASLRGTAADTGERGRIPAKRKVEAVTRLLRGDPIDVVSREYGVTAAKLARWKVKFLDGAEANLKIRVGTPQDDEVLRLKAMIGELTMRNELLRERCRSVEAGLPLGQRRPRP